MKQITPDNSAASVARPPGALPPLRTDLDVTQRRVAGRDEYVLKDPVSNRFFRVGEVEWFLARLLDGRRTLADLRARAAEQFPNAALGDDDVRHFVHQLAYTGMLRLGGRQEIDRLLAEPRPGLVARVLSLPGRLFYFRVPVVNPERFLSWLAPRTGWLFRPIALFVCGILVLAAVALAIWQADRLAEPRAEFLTPRGILWLAGALVVLKIFHELGHAVVCKRLGGRVSEMGLALIVFTPCLYCDVSDAWMFPSRWRRMAVTAAGIAVELTMAALAAVVFFLTRPGWLHQASFSLMVTASISTLLFNGNPLLRYDGYYLLSDWLDVPNLRFRARRWAAALIRLVMLGRPVSEADRPARHRPLLALYAAASYLYGWMILYVILGVLHHKLAPLGLGAAATLLIVLSVVAQVGVPLWRLAAGLGRMIRTPGNTQRFLRPAAITAALVLGVAVVLCLPVDDTLSRACVIAADEPIEVRAAEAGFVAEVRAAGGQHVEAGQVLAVIENAGIALRLRRLEFDLRDNELRLRRIQAAADRQADVAQLQLRGSQIQEALRAARAEMDSLAVTAPHEGIVLSWRPEQLIGRRVDKGDLLMELGRPGAVKAAIEMPERAAERVAVGSVVNVRVRALPDRTFTGRVAANSGVASIETPAVLTTRFEGDVAMRPSPAGWRPAEKVYRTEMELANPDLSLRHGMSGKARIHMGRRTLGACLWRTLTDQLSLDVLMTWR